MHYQMLVTIDMPAEANSTEVRETVRETLMNDESFCGEGGRFGAPLCDWFVIGGRWSGLLAETLIGGAFKQAICDRFPEQSEHFDPAALGPEHQGELDKLWAQCGGICPNPHSRSGYDDIGHSDDAMLLSQELYVSLLLAFEGRENISDLSHCEYADLDCEALSPDFIGRKWLVVVDYHN